MSLRAVGRPALWTRGRSSLTGPGKQGGCSEGTASRENNPHECRGANREQPRPTSSVRRLRGFLPPLSRPPRAEGTASVPEGTVLGWTLCFSHLLTCLREEPCSVCLRGWRQEFKTLGHVHKGCGVPLSNRALSLVLPRPPPRECRPLGIKGPGLVDIEKFASMLLH